ncbi:transport energizing protein TolR [Plesiocystis pacifica SIR-1]|uniref:Transport energizing protein TolR n=1 Tax=Plesiocystis pacifica SIR-1 TaxID=391625 RepID=A6GFY5_9BACT|nr:biopolymer transporter ExbD [Plesiocystis pacifica]EDM75230.1 transport energizing protein TolR [Plesiocystis pacifica SIR-1]
MSIVTHDGSASGEEPVAAINVTSLIDIMFCLLIGFMVATPLANQEQIKLAVPHAPGVQITEEEFELSVISVDAKGRVFVGTLPLDADKSQWSEQLATNKKITDDGMAFIQGDRNIQFEVILDIMIALQEAGVTEVGFVTDPRLPEE